MPLAWSLDRPKPTWVKKPKQVARLKEKISHCDVLAVDTETNGIDIARCSVRFWSLSTGEDRYFFERDMLEEFRPVFEDKRLTWVGSQVKFDVHMIANMGIDIAGDLFCTLTMDRLVDPDQEHGLKEAYEREFNERMATFGETFYPRNVKGKPYKPKGKELSQVMEEAWERDPERVIDYASLDAWGVFRLYNRLRERLQDMTTYNGYSLWDVFLKWEVHMTRVLYEMERRGTQLDIPYLKSLEPKIEKEMEATEKKLARVAKEAVNPGSSQQVSWLLYEKMELTPIAYTTGGKTGVKKPSVNEAVLTKHAAQGVEEAKLVLRYRKLGKILGTYVRGLQKRADDNGRIHGTFNQHRVDTARLSSTDPNLQNIPRPNSDEFHLRKAFIASPGHDMIDADYDQLEMFILAHFSGDPGLIGNIRKGRDIHTSNVELVFGEPYDDVAAAKKAKDDNSDRANYLRQLRDDIKAVGFGLNYGKAARSLGVQLGYHEKFRAENPHLNDYQVSAMATAKAQSIIDLYFKRIPGARNFILGAQMVAAETKYVETIIGRRRNLPQIMDFEEQLEHRRDVWEENPSKDLCWCRECKLSREGDRRAVNTIIQGTAADIIMAAMIRCHYDPNLRELGARMLIQIHDELLFEVPKEYTKYASKIIQRNMEHPGITLDVPLKAEPGVGRSWLEAK